MVDDLQLATQMGRLDFVSALLAITALIVGTLGVCGFGYIRWKSGQVAAKTARGEAAKVAREEAARAVGEYLEKNLPGMLDERLKVAKEVVNDEAAYDLSSAQ